MSGIAGAIDPTRAQFDAFKALPRDKPIQMLNLIRLRAVADYPPGHPDNGRGISGRDAYHTYASGAIFAKVGARQIWSGRPEVVVTGPPEERWDMAFIVEYPNAGAFLAMVTDPEYREHVKHRTAAVEDSRLIRLAPLPPGGPLGE